MFSETLPDGELPKFCYRTPTKKPDIEIPPYEIGTFSLFYFLFDILWLYFVSRYFYFPEIKIIDETKSLDNYSTIYKISSREKEAAQLLLEGLSYREIGPRLFISYETVKSHVNNIYIKSKVKSKMELAGLIRKCDRE